MPPLVVWFPLAMTLYLLDNKHPNLPIERGKKDREATNINLKATEHKNVWIQELPERHGYQE